MKKSTPDNHRVEVFPNDWNILSHKTLLADSEEIMRSILRHVDGVESAAIEFDYEHTCSFCGRDWTEDSDDYNGGCCDKDEANNPNPEDK